MVKRRRAGQEDEDANDYQEAVEYGIVKTASQPLAEEGNTWTDHGVGVGGGPRPSNMYQVKDLLPFDPQVYKLALRPPLDLSEDKTMEEQLPELAQLMEARAELKEYEKTRKELLESNIDVRTIPEFLKVAHDLSDEEEGYPGGLEPSALSGANVAKKVDRVRFSSVCPVLVLFRRVFVVVLSFVVFLLAVVLFSFDKAYVSFSLVVLLIHQV